MHFFKFLINSILKLHNRDIVHSCITPWNIIITSDDNKYKIIGTNSLYYPDEVQQKIYFVRKIDEREIIFMAPEIIDINNSKSKDYK